MYSFKYIANILNLKYEEEKAHGIVFGETYAKAMENIEKFYGSDLISVEIYMMEETLETIFDFENNEEDKTLFKISIEESN